MSIGLTLNRAWIQPPLTPAISSRQAILSPLAGLHDVNVFCGLQERGMSSRIEPSCTYSEQLDFQRLMSQINLMKVRNLPLT